jgi:hypothetical protein
MLEGLSDEQKIEEGFKAILNVANDIYIKIISISNDRDYYTVKAELEQSLFYGIIVERAIIEVEFILSENQINIMAIKPQVTVITRYAMQQKTYEYLYVPIGLAYLIAVKGLLKYFRQSN